MDQTRFDAFTRAFARGISRRVFLKGASIGGGAGVAGFGLRRGPVRSLAQADNEGAACVPPECNALQVFSEETCSCICQVDCLPNFAPDPNSCICYCTLSDFFDCGDPILVYDAGLCACVCANEDCPGDAVLDPETCACYCPEGIVCGDGEAPDPVTCECTCVRECAGNQILDNCECVCANDDCDAPFILDEVACACVCPPDLSCERPFVLDSVTCACVCSEEEPCSAVHQRDPGTCACICIASPICEAPKVQDPTSCECVCSGEITCPDGNPPHPDSCSCDCVSPLVECNNQCIEPCLPTQKFNAGCICEEIICPPDRPLVCACGCPSGMTDCKGECVTACGPNKVFDWGCQCVCMPNMPCPDRRVLDPKTCECVCKDTTCPPAREWIPEQCRCVCPRNISCPEGKNLDNQTCECVCQEVACPANKVLDPETCQCVCPGVSCLAAEVLDPETCTCGCPKEIVCDKGQSIEPLTCSCVCQEVACPANKVLDPETCNCLCAPDLKCPNGQTLDPVTCACGCKPGNVLETIEVPCSGQAVISTTTLKTGVTYPIRASGVCSIGFVLPAADDADAEYAFTPADPTNLAKKRDKCPGGSNIELGIGIDDSTFDNTKTPYWGPYNPTHIYTINFKGKGASISVNYHDCVHRDNKGSIKIEILCPDPTDPAGDPGTGVVTPDGCLDDCPPNMIATGTCECVCKPSITCAEGRTLDPLTCACVCPEIECPAGREINPDTCQCACPASITCPAGKRIDPETCACVCKRPTCPGKSTLNKETCECACAATLTCQAGEVFDTKTCECACLPGTLLDTVTVPVNGFSAWSTFSLRSGINYILRASGTFKIGKPPLDQGDAEYAFDSANPAIVANARDKCGPAGSIEDYGLAINTGGYLVTKYPRWGPYTSTHVYTTTWPGNDSVIALNYHDCITGDNTGSLTVEIYCPDVSDGSDTPGSDGG